MKLVFTYSDGKTLEREFDGATVVSVDGPARNGTGSLVAGRLSTDCPVTEDAGTGPTGERLSRTLSSISVVRA